MSGEWVRIDYLGKPMLVRRLVRSSIAPRERGERSTEELDLKSRTFLLFPKKKWVVLVASSSTLAGVILRVTVTVDRKRQHHEGSEGSKRRSSRFLRK
jgi:hypothetical protein